MKTIVRQPIVNASNQIELATIGVENIAVKEHAFISIDGSTTNSGIAILRECDGAFMYSLSAAREKNDESPVRYKVRLKQLVAGLLRQCPLIHTVYYEEPCLEYVTAIANTMMLKTFLEEMQVENEPEFDHIKIHDVSNKRWKKLFLAPDKCPVGTELEKKAVQEKLIKLLPFLAGITQDEMDAIAMGYAAKVFMQDGHTAEELESKKKARPFKYNIEFIGADDDDSAFGEFWDNYSGPKSLLENGIAFEDVPSRGDFDKFVYGTMGGDDKVLILKFSSEKHGNIILKHRIGFLAEQYEYLYAIVWRATRKY